MEINHDHQTPMIHSNTKNIFIHICATCNKEMHIGEGDIIYGMNWYHNTCWEKVEKNVANYPIGLNKENLKNY